MAPDLTSADFSRPTVQTTVTGFLLDWDGTIVDSTQAIEKHWHRLANELGFDPQVVLATSHGRRSIDTLAALAPEKANWDYVHQVEGRIPYDLATDAHLVPGAADVLASLAHNHCPWAVVTSGSRPLIHGWLDVMHLARPSVLVTAEDVQQGKPAPDCYRLGRERIQQAMPSAVAAAAPKSEPSLSASNPSPNVTGQAQHVSSNDTSPNSSYFRVLVVEDAPSGVKAGKAAGCQVLGLATTHDPEKLRAAGADWIIRDLESFAIKGRDATGHAFNVEIRNALQ